MRPLLIVAMMLGIAAIFALPVALLWVASQMVESTQPTMGPIVFVIVGLGVGVSLIAKGLGKLDRMYAAAGGEVPQRYRPGWTRSMRGERESNRTWSILDRVMLVSVILCFICMGIWFFFFAGSSLPTQ